MICILENVWKTKSIYMIGHTHYTMKCIKCGKALGYVRIATKEWVCRACGKVSPIVIKEKQKQEVD